MNFTPEHEAFQWQVGVWDRISQLYFGEIDPRFAPRAAHRVADKLCLQSHFAEAPLPMP